MPSRGVPTSTLSAGGASAAAAFVQVLFVHGLWRGVSSSKLWGISRWFAFADARKPQPSVDMLADVLDVSSEELTEQLARLLRASGCIATTADEPTSDAENAARALRAYKDAVDAHVALKAGVAATVGVAFLHGIDGVTRGGLQGTAAARAAAARIAGTAFGALLALMHIGRSARARSGGSRGLATAMVLVLTAAVVAAIALPILQQTETDADDEDEASPPSRRTDRAIVVATFAAIVTMVLLAARTKARRTACAPSAVLPEAAAPPRRVPSRPTAPEAAPEPTTLSTARGGDDDGAFAPLVADFPATEAAAFHHAPAETTAGFLPPRRLAGSACASESRERACAARPPPVASTADSATEGLTKRRESLATGRSPTDATDRPPIAVEPAAVDAGPPIAVEPAAVDAGPPPSVVPSAIPPPPQLVVDDRPKATPPMPTPLPAPSPPVVTPVAPDLAKETPSPPVTFEAPRLPHSPEERLPNATDAAVPSSMVPPQASPEERMPNATDAAVPSSMVPPQAPPPAIPPPATAQTRQPEDDARPRGAATRWQTGVRAVRARSPPPSRIAD